MEEMRRRRFYTNSDCAYIGSTYGNEIRELICFVHMFAFMREYNYYKDLQRFKAIYFF